VWTQGAERPRFFCPLTPSEVPGFFRQHAAALAPDAIYRAKTWARLEKTYQLDFVDTGLLPVVEEAAGEKLRNVIERALILESNPEIQPDSLPDFELEGRLHKAVPPKVIPTGSLDHIMANFERELIISTLEQNHYNLIRAADQLKISRHALRYRMQRFNISLDNGTDEEPPEAPDQETPA